MIKVPKITMKDMEVFRKKKVVLYGYSDVAKGLCKVLKGSGIEIIAIWSDSPKQRLKISCQGVPILGWDGICRFKKKYENIIVQFTIYDENIIKDIQKKCNLLNISSSSMSAGEIRSLYHPKLFLEEIKNPIIYRYENRKWMKAIRGNTERKLKKFINGNPQNPILICLPPKTADYTLNYLFDFINAQSQEQLIEYYNSFHKPKFIKTFVKVNSSKVKVITGVREPISQNLSIMYQEISGGGNYKNWILGELEQQADKQKGIKELEEVLYEKDDINLLFDSFINRFIYNDNQLTTHSNSIQQFIPDFANNICDILSYPFDKELGFTIIKQNNMEIFVYQLEKLNSIIPYLSEWIGIHFETLEKVNVGLDKWIGTSYKQAQKEIKITQEYFDCCYNEPYVKHCYSDADIEKFKKKWIGNIKNS